MSTLPALETHGRRALVRLGARVSLIYLAGTAFGLAAGVGGGPRPWWFGLAAAGEVLALGLVIALGLNGMATPRFSTAAWLLTLRLVVIAAGLGVLARVVASGGAVGWPKVHVLVGWVIPGVGLGLAFAAGPAWAIAGFVVLSAGFALMVPREAADAVPATVAAASVTVVVAMVLRWATRRGFATTEGAILAAESAAVARLHAEHRLLASRRLDRVLHDTLLSTLTLLAHGGHGVEQAALRAACRRDLAALRSDHWSGANVPTGGDDVTAAPQLPGAPRGSREATALAERLAAVRELAARQGVDLRVHLQNGEPALPDDDALDAWSGALAECVLNISRHAGVAAADVVLGSTDEALVTLVLDEGSGFEPTQVRPERLGLSGSVRDRLHDVGGEARIWSRPGQGTVVELLLPLPFRTSGGPP